jgi:heat shock protein HslJ
VREQRREQHQGSTPSASLDGTGWVLHAMTPPVAGTADAVVTAKFASGTLSGHSGCNTYRASYHQDGSDLTVGSDIATTQIACPPGPTAVERAYLAHLAKVASFARSGRAPRSRSARWLRRCARARTTR